MIDISNYLQVVGLRMDGLGIAEPGIRSSILSQVRQEVLSSLAQELSVTTRDLRFRDVPQSLIQRVTRAHKMHQLPRILAPYTGPSEQERALDRNPAVQGFDRMADSITESAQHHPSVQGMLNHPPVLAPYGLDETQMLRAYLVSFRQGMRERIGEFDVQAFNDAWGDRDIDGLGFTVGLIWGMTDSVVNDIESAIEMFQTLYTLITEGPPPELVAAARQVYEILNGNLPPQLQQQLIELSSQIGHEMGDDVARDFVNEISLVYRVSENVPRSPLSPHWGSVVLGRVTAPLIMALMSFVPVAGQAGLAVNLSARIVRLLPRLRRPLQIISRTMRRLGRLRRGRRPNSRSSRGSSGPRASSSSSPTNPSGQTSSPSSSSSSSRGQSSSDADPSGSDRGLDRPDQSSPSESSDTSPSSQSDNDELDPVEEYTPPHESVPRSRRRGTGRPARTVPHPRGRPYAPLTGETAQTGGIRTVSGAVLDDNSVEVQLQGVIRDSIRAHHQRDRAARLEQARRGSRVRGLSGRDVSPRFEEMLPTGREVSVDGVPFPRHQRSHLWGPGFGDEARDGIMLAPRNLNQIWQNKGIERHIRDLHEQVAALGGRVDLRVTAQSFPMGTLDQRRARVLLLQSVRYEVSVYLPERGMTRAQSVFDIRIDVDGPTPDARAILGDITRGPLFSEFY